MTVLPNAFSQRSNHTFSVLIKLVEEGNPALQYWGCQNIESKYVIGMVDNPDASDH